MDCRDGGDPDRKPDRSSECGCRAGRRIEEHSIDRRMDSDGDREGTRRTSCDIGRRTDRRKQCSNDKMDKRLVDAGSCDELGSSRTKDSGSVDGIGSTKCSKQHGICGCDV